LAINTTIPFKNGTLSSIGAGANGANTRLNTSGVTWASSDVGRHVYFYSGNASWESREIIAKGLNFCDIEFAFGTFPVSDADGVEIPSDAPSAGDLLGVSYSLADIHNGVDLIQDSAISYRAPSSGSWTIGADVMIHDVQKNLIFSSPRMDLNGILQLGNLDKSGNPSNSCSVVDTSDSTAGFSGAGNQINSANDFGSFRMFGGSMTTTGARQFLRLNRSGTDSRATQLHGINLDGRCGGRIDGSKSYWYKCIYSNLSFNFGPMNPVANIAYIAGIVVNSGRQVLYHLWAISKTITVSGIRFAPNEISECFLLSSQSQTASNFTLTVDDILLDDLETLDSNGIPIVKSTGSANTNNAVKLTNPLSVLTQNNTSGFRLRIKNAAGIEQFDGDSDSSGAWAKASYLWGNLNILTGSGSRSLADFTTYGPYLCNARKYDSLTQIFVFSAREPQLSTIPDVNDNTTSEADEAVVAAYTELENLDKLRDRHKYEHIERAGVEDITGGASLSFIHSTNIEGAYLGYKLVVDDAAASPWAIANDSVVIKASTLAAGTKTRTLIPYSALELRNNASISCDINIISTVFVTVQNTGTVTGLVNLQPGGTLITSDLTGAKVQGAGGVGGRIRVDGASTSQTLDLSDYTLPATGFEVENNSGVSIAVYIPLGVTLATIETSGGITVIPATSFCTIQVPSIIDGSRFQIYNSTQSTELANDLTSGGKGIDETFTSGAHFNAGDLGRVRVAYSSGATAKETIELFFNFTEQTSVNSFPNVQADDAVYNQNGINGEGITKFAADYVDDEIDIVVGANFTLADLYAWWVYNTTTSQGVSDFFGGLTAEDAANFKINNSVVDIFLDNATTVEVFSTDNSRLYRADGARPVKGPTSGGGGIDVEWREKVLIANIDSVIDTNVVKINGVTLQGSGVPGDSMRPI